MLTTSQVGFLYYGEELESFYSENSNDLVWSGLVMVWSGLVWLGMAWDGLGWAWSTIQMGKCK